MCVPSSAASFPMQTAKLKNRFVECLSDDENVISQSDSCIQKKIIPFKPPLTSCCSNTSMYLIKPNWLSNSGKSSIIWGEGLRRLHVDVLLDEHTPSK